MRPIKLLVCAILTASLTEIVVRPLLGPIDSAVVQGSDSIPRSLHRSTGSAMVSMAELCQQHVAQRLTVRLLPVQRCANVLVVR